MKTIVAAALSTSLLVSACASNPDSISAAYVSPMQYQPYDCEQLRVELLRVQDRVNTLTGQQRRQANNDAIAMGVGLVIFWPALFFLAGGNDKREELSRLKGEYDALNVVAVQKRCGFDSATAPAAN